MSDEYSSETIIVNHLDKMDFLALLEHIERLPAILPERNIWCFEAFLNGWLIHNTDNGFMTEFQKYIFHQFGNVNSNQGWAKIINFYSQDSYDALDQFFKLLSDFRKDRSTVV